MAREAGEGPYTGRGQRSGAHGCRGETVLAGRRLHVQRISALHLFVVKVKLMIDGADVMLTDPVPASPVPRQVSLAGLKGSVSLLCGQPAPPPDRLKIGRTQVAPPAILSIRQPHTIKSSPGKFSGSRTAERDRSPPPSTVPRARLPPFSLHIVGFSCHFTPYTRKITRAKPIDRNHVHRGRERRPPRGGRQEEG